jgi:hypothetical protein
MARDAEIRASSDRGKTAGKLEWPMEIEGTGERIYVDSVEHGSSGNPTVVDVETGLTYEVIATGVVRLIEK